MIDPRRLPQPRLDEIAKEADRAEGFAYVPAQYVHDLQDHIAALTESEQRLREHIRSFLTTISICADEDETWQFAMNEMSESVGRLFSEALDGLRAADANGHEP